MATVTFLGSKPIEVHGFATVQTRASLGPEMTPIKVAQKELCDGYMHLFNPGEKREVNCKCPDMRHIRQFLRNEHFQVTLGPAEKLKLARIERKEKSIG